MRDIKFKAWDKQEQEMVGKFLPDWGSVDQERYILLQYTGLKAYDGKEIYEGDVLLHEGLLKREIVEWKNEMWTEEGFMTGYGEWFGTANQYEILGNIWENPELNVKKRHHE